MGTINSLDSSEVIVLPPTVIKTYLFQNVTFFLLLWIFTSVNGAEYNYFITYETGVMKE